MTKLEAPDGYMYSNGETSGKVVYLGNNDTEENWKLVSEDIEELTETEQKALAYDIVMGVAE